jgi:hypothetical protein
VDPRASLDNMEKLKFLTIPGLEPRPLSRPARSQSLYRLRYLGSIVGKVIYFNNCEEIQLTIRVYDKENETMIGGDRFYSQTDSNFRIFCPRL